MKPPLLGIDYGSVRIGLAASDSLGMVARPLETVAASPNDPDPLRRIAEVVGELGIGGLVLGIPYRLDGSTGPAAERALAFAERLRRRFPQLPLELADERLTSVEARENLRRSGLREREMKGRIDPAAAAAILQEHLNRAAGGPPLLPPDADG